MKQVQQGGVREDIVQLLSKASSELRTSLIILLLLAIVFIEKIPRGIANTLSTLYGRAILFTAVLGIAYYVDHPSSILALVLALLLLVKGTPTFSEGFVPDMDDTLQFVGNERRWWSEIVLKVNPIAIEKDRVNTIPIQDDNEENANKVQNTKDNNNSSFK
uniref:Uncharacterized protein n=1 Tax=viral metagenome TaxID=1070528 RepID=A0A6C0BIZ8_9ZZZZ